ncbi:hypothetical protein Hdeb2414_s0032g00714851 [Helianthus debilis subsp. tardiflorus]
MIVREGDKVCAFRCLFLLVDTIATHLRERWSANQNANTNAKLKRKGTTPPVDVYLID